MGRKLDQLFRACGYADESVLALACSLSSSPLSPAQEKAITGGRVLQGGRFCFLARPGNGQDLVGEAALLPAISNGRMAVWLASDCAVARRKVRRLESILGPEGYRVVLATPESREAENSICSGRVDVVVGTAEALRPLFPRSPVLAAETGVVVAEHVEAAMRHPAGGELQTLLALWGAQAHQPQIVALGRPFAGAPAFADAMGMTLFHEQAPPREWRGEAVLESGVVERRKDSSVGISEGMPEEIPIIAREETLAASAVKLLSIMEKPVLFAVSTRPEARRVARALAGTAAEDAFTSFGEMEFLRLLAQGVGLYTGDQTASQQDQVAGAFEAGRLGACVADFASLHTGELPAKTVLIVPPPSPPPGFDPEALFGQAGAHKSGTGCALLLFRTEEQRQRYRRHETNAALAPVSAEQAEKALAGFLAAEGGEVPQNQVEAFLTVLPDFPEEPRRIVDRGAGQGFWRRSGEQLRLTPTGEVLAEGTVDAGTLLGWRTMLRRFPEGGGLAENLFLAFGDGSAGAAMPLAAEERRDARWISELIGRLQEDGSGLARYLRDYLDVPSPLPRHTHQAAKGVLFLLREKEAALDPYGLTPGEAERLRAGLWRSAEALQALADRLGGGVILPEDSSATRGVVRKKHEQESLLILRKNDRAVLFGGKQIHLTRNQFAFLELLARYPGELVTYERLDGYIWPDANVQRQQFSYYRKVINGKLNGVLPRRKPYVETQPALGMRLALVAREIRIEESRGLRWLQDVRRPVAINSIARPPLLASG